MAIKWNRRNRPPLEEEEVRKTVNSILRKDALRRDEHVSWPNPIPLRDDLLLPVPVFPPDLIPLPLRPWILDVADRMQCPIEIPFVAAMVSLATVVGNRIAIRPKALDDWTGVPNLWGAVVGEPGLVMKTPAIQEGMKPLSILAQELQDNYEQALEKRRPADSHGHEPKEEMLIVNDTTVEALGELLNENPHGLMLYRDELVGFIAYLDRSNHRGDRQFFLECWNGKGTYRIRRIKRGRLTVKNTILSILGGIQPDPLKRYLREAFARGKGNDGFIQRFQLMVFPEFKADWHMVDKKPDKEAQEIVVNLFRKLRALRPASIGAEIEEGTKNPLPFLHFSRQAQLFFNQWYEKHRRNIEKRIANGMTNGPLDQHFIKYDGLMSSLALHFHLLDVVAKRTSKTRVGLNAAKRAARFCALLAAHARKVYGLLEKEDITRVRTLQNHIRRGELPNPFTSRDVYRKNWSILNSKAEVVRALNALKRLHWLRSSREEGGERGGRPTYRYYINPKVLQ
jgi:putative DNA primase/helicase